MQNNSVFVNVRYVSTATPSVHELESEAPADESPTPLPEIASLAPLASLAKRRHGRAVRAFFHFRLVRASLLGLLLHSAHAKNASPVNLASFGTVRASSEEIDRGNLARHAIDDDSRTRWCSKGLQPGSWLSLDLGGTCTLTKVVVEWEQAVSYTYSLEGSLDGKTWFALGGQEKVQAVGTGTHSFSQRIRHLRVTHRDPTIKVWSSIREVQVWGVPE